MCYLARQTVTSGEGKLAMDEGAVDDLPDLRHALQYGSHPARRQRVELQPRRVLVQAPEQRLRHHRIANPGRGDHQGFKAVRSQE